MHPMSVAIAWLLGTWPKLACCTEHPLTRQLYHWRTKKLTFPACTICFLYLVTRNWGDLLWVERLCGKTLKKGYLPGRMAPLMNFYVFMSLAYLALMGGFFSTWGAQRYNVNSKLDLASHCSWFIRNDSVVLRIFEFQPCRSSASRHNHLGFYCERS